MTKEATKALVTTSTLDEVTLVKNSSGELRRIKSKLGLCINDNTLVKIINAKKGFTSKYGKKIDAKPPVLIPTFTGWMQEAARCGVVIDPNRDKLEVMVDGKLQGNGYKDAGGTYFCRARAGGYTALGTKFVTDRTVEYNVERQNIQDLLAKAKHDNNVAYFKVLPFRGRDEFKVLRGEPKDGDWAGYQVDNSTVLWVNCKAPDFVKWLSEMNNKADKALRTCQTFADRNAIAAHPALPVKKKFDTDNVVLDCVSWYAPKGAIDIFKQLSEGGDDDITYNTEQINLNDDKESGQVIDVEGSVVPENAEDVETVEKKEEMEEKPPVAEKAEKAEKAEPPKKNDKAHAKILKKVSDMAEMKQRSYAKARESMGLDDAEALEMLSTKQLEELFKLLKMA